MRMQEFCSGGETGVGERRTESVVESVVSKGKKQPKMATISNNREDY
jgi:hypothetical protein